MRGRPFFYFSFGAAMAEVAIDTLTGESRVLRADLVQDCGESLNPAIDLGQIEGAFVQGQGWLTCEELWWDSHGPAAHRGPVDLQDPGQPRRAAGVQREAARECAVARATIFRSKAVGEPPLMLATAVRTALKDAIGAVGDRKVAVRLDAPATPERVLAAVERARRGSNSRSMSCTSVRSISRRAAFSSLASAIHKAASLKAPESRKVIGSTPEALIRTRRQHRGSRPRASERTPCGASISRQRCQPSTAGASIR